MEKHPSMGDQFLAMIHQIIEDNIGNENFSVEGLAQKAGISRSMLHRKLKKLIGKSASDLITEIRITRAKNLLENDVATASEIAYHVGFSDPSYFSKVFKKHFKVSPGMIRKVSSTQNETTFREKVPGRLEEATPRNKWSTKRIMVFVLIVITTGSGILILFGKKSKTDSERSLAVLPLRNLTGITENDYLVDGLHDALTGELSQIESLRVISTTSTRHFHNNDLLIPEISDILGVNTIIEGSVRSAGDSLLFTIQLIDVFPKERHLFSHEYHDAMENVLTVHKQVAKDIAQKLNIKLSKHEEELFTSVQTVHPETYRAYLKGMYYINQGTVESTEMGINCLAEAIHRNPGDPLAYAGFALGKALQGHGMIAPRVAFRSAEVAAEKALIIEPTNNEAQTALALLYLYQYWDWPATQDAFEKALAINPNNATAHAHYAWYHILFGNREASIHHAQMAVDVDPLSAIYQSWLAWIHYHFGNYDEAEYWAAKSVELNEHIPWGNLVLGWTYLKNQEYSKALETHEKLPDNSTRWLWFRCRTYLLTGNREMAESLWDELNEESEYFINPFYKGMIAGILGYTDVAFELLNEACDNRYYPIVYMDVFASSEFIKDDPRYNALLHKLNLPANQKLLTELK